jgi:chromosome segregation ATPase
MGRAGVTLQEVEKAALQLQGRGKNPSVDAVREMIGSGSKSTIAQHLRDWKAQQSYASGKLPQDLLALVTGLWERLNLQADQRITEIETASNEKIQELKQTLAKLHQDYSHLQKQLHQSEEMHMTEKTAKNTLEKELLNEQQEYTKLLERHQSNVRQLEDYKSENMRLHQLANNIQANLEHYQNAIQQLYTEHNLIIEKQQIQYQQETAELQRELVLLRGQLKEYEQKIAHNNAELKQLHILNQQYEDIKKDMQNHTHEFVLLKERSEQYKQQLQIANNDLTEKNRHIFECEKQMAILADHNNRLQNQLLSVEDKIELLRQEKSFLAQEKAELQGYLKQLEKTLSNTDQKS